MADSLKSIYSTLFKFLKDKEVRVQEIKKYSEYNILIPKKHNSFRITNKNEGVQLDIVNCFLTPRYYINLYSCDPELNFKFAIFDHTVHPDRWLVLHIKNLDSIVIYDDNNISIN